MNKVYLTPRKDQDAAQLRSPERLTINPEFTHKYKKALPVSRQGLNLQISVS